MTEVRIIHADVLDGLAQLADESVHCCVTSPPYWGLRDYGHERQIGLEPTPDEFVDKLVAVFREVKRALRKDGTLWLNLGDSYAGSGKASNNSTMDRPCRGMSNIDAAPKRWLSLPSGIKSKDLVGIPWMTAFALRADGWHLRQEVIWSKPNPMPESVIDRCTKSHEHIFLLSKSERYSYDAEAIREPAERRGLSSWADRKKTEPARRGDPGVSGHITTTATLASREGRNKRSVWTIATQPYPGAHFATFPEAIPKTCILAGCPLGGLVLDPFFGSGTTGLVARELGRNCVGIELNSDYVTLAQRRLSKPWQASLFNEAPGAHGQVGQSEADAERASVSEPQQTPCDGLFSNASHSVTERDGMTDW